jgi:RHS repeat-associated protein
MVGISSKAATKIQNKFKFNDGTELNNSFDISLYETDFRLYDSQIGRFAQLDELAILDYGFSPYVFANNNPILLNDPQGLSADTAWQDLAPVVLTSKKPLDAQNGQVLPYQSRLWESFFGRRSFEGHIKRGNEYISINWDVNNKGYLTGRPAIMRLELAFTPDKSAFLTIKQVIKLKNLVKSQYVVYKAMKNGTPYIGKALESLMKRYGSEAKASEIAAQVIKGLDNIPNNMVALGVEQLVMDLNGGLQRLSNKMPATVKEIYINEARYWLDNNLANWEHVLKFQ